MGTFADSLFNVLMSWVRALVSAFWALFSSENTTALGFLGKNWLLIALAIVAAGLVIDWLVWLIRWQPYHLWARRARRLLRIAEPEDEDDDEGDAPEAAYDASFAGTYEDEDDDMRVYRPAKKKARAVKIEDEDDERALWLPQPYETDEAPDEEAEEAAVYAEALGEEDEQAAMQAAQDVPDEELRAYPGMRYGTKAQAADEEDAMGGTQRYAAVHSEGPGAAEVKSRRAEIDAWQQQMQEEARQKAQAERARLEAQRLEQERIEREAYEAEQARLAQEEYERQMEEYEQKRAQYERELAEYERQKAVYDAQMAALAAQEAGETAQAEPEMQAAPAVDMEAAAELTPQEESPRPRRRRSRAAVQEAAAEPEEGILPETASYSDLIEGEQVEELPPPPSWPKMERRMTAEPEEETKPAKENGLLSRMARMIEPEEEDIASLRALPPRVDMKKAYKPAKKPKK